MLLCVDSDAASREATAGTLRDAGFAVTEAATIEAARDHVDDDLDALVTEQSHREFQRSGIDRVRTGLFSLSTLLSFGDLKTVSRFVHTLVGRIDALDGLGVLLIDPAIHDDQTVRTLSQFCTGRIDVREGDEGPELRARGLPEQSREWQPFDAAEK